MGPVAFQRIASDLDRDGLLQAAKRLTAAGIRVQTVDVGDGILVRSEDIIRARAVLGADAEQSHQ